jgi:hypothetical protein
MDELAKMSVEEINKLDTDKVGQYQRKYANEGKLTPEQIIAFQKILRDKTIAEGRGRPLYGGKTRRRKGRKSRRSRK